MVNVLVKKLTFKHNKINVEVFFSCVMMVEEIKMSVFAKYTKVY
jgi:hypothetical protein